MIIDDFYIMGITICPPKTDPPLIIDPDAVETFSVAFQYFEPVTRRHAKIDDVGGGINVDEFS
jgi:hypothetical protein